MIARRGGLGIAIDDLAALEVEGRAWRALQGRESAAVWRVRRCSGRAVQDALPADGKLRPWAALQG